MAFNLKNLFKKGESEATEEKKQEFASVVPVKQKMNELGVPLEENDFSDTNIAQIELAAAVENSNAMTLSAETISEMPAEENDFSSFVEQASADFDDPLSEYLKDRNNAAVDAQNFSPTTKDFVAKIYDTMPPQKETKKSATVESVEEIEDEPPKSAAVPVAETKNAGEIAENVELEEPAAEMLSERNEPTALASANVAEVSEFVAETKDADEIAAENVELEEPAAEILTEQIAQTALASANAAEISEPISETVAETKDAGGKSDGQNQIDDDFNFDFDADLAFKAAAQNVMKVLDKFDENAGAQKDFEIPISETKLENINAPQEAFEENIAAATKVFERDAKNDIAFNLKEYSEIAQLLLYMKDLANLTADDAKDKFLASGYEAKLEVLTKIFQRKSGLLTESEFESFAEHFVSEPKRIPSLNEAVRYMRTLVGCLESAVAANRLNEKISVLALKC